MTRPLALAAVLVLLLAVAGGAWWAWRERGPRYAPPPVEGGWIEGLPGLWALAPRDPSAGAGAGIGELSYASGYEPPGAEGGILVHDRERAEAGWNLYCSGHAPEAILMDMEGAVAHRWSLDHRELPDAPPLDDAHQNCWRRVRLCPDGALLAIYGGRGLVKVDRESRLLWHFPERAHHDLEVLPDGGVWTLVREERLLPAVNPNVPVIDDAAVLLSADGEVRERHSVLEALLASPWGARELVGRRRAGDLLHTNALRVLDGSLAARHPAFAAGNLLLCARDADLVFVLDPRRGKAVWTHAGPWRGPHDPRPVGEDRLLVFDNLGASTPGRNASRLVEVAVPAGELVWSWRPATPRTFYSLFCGTAARLAGGNTLVTESCAGRAFELAPDGAIVWEFASPHRAGRDDELVAALFEVERLPPDAAPWLER